MNVDVFEDGLQKQTNFDRICRCCLIERTNMKSIFEASLSDIIMSCANITVSDTDGLPSLICFQCVQQVNRSFTFRQQCERSDSMLRHWFQKPETEELSQDVVVQQDTASTEMKYINVLLECVSPENNLKSTIMLPIDEMQRIQLLDGKTVYLTKPNNATVDANTTVVHLNGDVSELTQLNDTQQIVSNDFQQPEQLSLNNIVSLDQTNITLNISESLNTISTDPSLAAVQQGHEELNICNVGVDDDDQFINAQFLNGKMPVIPDAYIEMMNSFEPSDMSNQASPVLTPEPEIHIQIEMDKLNTDSLLNETQPQIENLQDQEQKCEKLKSEEVIGGSAMQKTTVDESMVCEVCNKELKGAIALRRHMKIHTTQKQYVCQYCSKAFADPSYLTKHIKRHTGDKAYTCSVCRAKFYEASILKVHMRIHTGEKPFKCPDCQKSFAQSNQLETHKLTHKTNRENICRICKKAFTLKWQLNVHMRTHTGDRPYACSLCDKRFTQSGNLAMHQRVHTGEKPYTCSECNPPSHFASAFQLKVHFHKHTGIRPEPKATCQVCGKKCTNNGELKVHMRSHTGERPYLCHCQKRFLMHAHLVVHQRVHTGEKPYKCSFCDKCFATATMLKKHVYIHTGEKNYACSQCDKKFTQPGARNTHEKIHLKEQKASNNKISGDIVLCNDATESGCSDGIDFAHLVLDSVKQKN